MFNITGLSDTMMQPTPASGPAGEANEIPTEARKDQSGCSKGGGDAPLQGWWRPNSKVAHRADCRAFIWRGPRNCLIQCLNTIWSPLFPHLHKPVARTKWTTSGFLRHEIAAKLIILYPHLKSWRAFCWAFPPNRMTIYILHTLPVCNWYYKFYLYCSQK